GRPVATRSCLPCQRRDTAPDAPYEANTPGRISMDGPSPPRPASATYSAPSGPKARPRGLSSPLITVVNAAGTARSSRASTLSLVRVVIKAVRSWEATVVSEVGIDAVRRREQAGNHQGDAKRIRRRGEKTPKWGSSHSPGNLPVPHPPRTDESLESRAESGRRAYLVGSYFRKLRAPR